MDWGTCCFLARVQRAMSLNVLIHEPIKHHRDSGIRHLVTNAGKTSRRQQTWLTQVEPQLGIP